MVFDSLEPIINPDTLKRAEAALLKYLPDGAGFEPDTIRLLARYCVALLSINEKVNLTGAKDVEELVLKHVVDVILATKAPFSFSKKLVDVGSGGGIPGIILSILNKGTLVHLVERRQKKASCLRELVKSLDLEKRIYVLSEDFAQVRPPFTNEDLWFRGFLPGADLAKFLTEVFPAGKSGKLFLMKGPRWEQEKEEILGSKNVSEEWKERIVKKSKEYKYVLPEQAGERVLVCI